MIFNNSSGLQVMEAMTITFVDQPSPLTKRSQEPSSSNLPRMTRFQKQDMICSVNTFREAYACPVFWHCVDSRGCARNGVSWWWWTVGACGIVLVALVFYIIR